MYDVASAGQTLAEQHGGFLRCETCRAVGPVRGRYLSTGWPRCCGYTMRWWTARQVTAGEVPS